MTVPKKANDEESTKNDYGKDGYLNYIDNIVEALVVLSSAER